ncbi:Co-chaperone [Tilletia horrida]|nr:Co-chaperone [Tilletia horrida]
MIASCLCFPLNLPPRVISLASASSVSTKTKGCTPWARDWLSLQCVAIAAEEGDLSVQVDGLQSLEGDVELGNRKGKLITIFDTSVTFAWSGSKGADKVDGLLICEEFSHEVHDEKRDYEFKVTQTSGPSSAKALVQKQIVPQLLAQINGFRAALIETHAKDLGHDDAPSAGSSGAATPAAAAAPAAAGASAPAAAKAAPQAASAPAPKAVSSTSTSASDVRVSLDLPMARDDLWDLLTNPARIPMWSRSAAQFSTEAGASFSLFGGNVTGTVESAEAPRSLVQKWRVQQWPAAHFGTLRTTLNEGHDSTKLELVLSGVPTGEEEQMEKGLRTFYLTSLQTVVGGVLA